MHAPEGFAQPMLQEVHLATEVPLLALGQLGRVDESDPANIRDSRTAPRQVEANDPGLPLADLQGDAMAFGTGFLAVPREFGTAKGIAHNPGPHTAWRVRP
jgi:hypothetical protein